MRHLLERRTGTANQPKTDRASCRALAKGHNTRLRSKGASPPPPLPPWAARGAVRRGALFCWHGSVVGFSMDDPTQPCATVWADPSCCHAPLERPASALRLLVPFASQHAPLPPCRRMQNLLRQSPPLSPLLLSEPKPGRQVPCLTSPRAGRCRPAACHRRRRRRRRSCQPPSAPRWPSPWRWRWRQRRQRCRHRLPRPPPAPTPPS